jgi:hypothetical protein
MQVEYTVDTSYKAVESGKSTLASTLNGTKAFHDTNLKSFADAREKYFKYVEDSADYVKGVLNPKPLIDTTYAALKDALARAQTLADPDVAVDTVHEAWTKFAALAPGEEPRRCCCCCCCCCLRCCCLRCCCPGC